MSIKNNIAIDNYMSVSGNYDNFGRSLIEKCEMYINSNNVTLEGLERMDSFIPTNPEVIDEPKTSKCLQGVKEYKEQKLKPLIAQFKMNKTNHNEFEIIEENSPRMVA